MWNLVKYSKRHGVFNIIWWVFPQVVIKIAAKTTAARMAMMNRVLKMEPPLIGFSASS
jgi:hypothetical protein